MFYKKQRSWDMRASGLVASDITPKHLFDNRRQFITRAGKGAAGLSMGLALGSIAGGQALLANPGSAHAATGLSGKPNMAHTLQSLNEDELTSYDAATSYNNFYEFGTGKSDPIENAVNFEPLPWTVTVDGEVANPGIYDFGDLIRPHQMEERVYRFRCVEAWSMIVPWLGVPLGDVIARLEPTSKAKYVAFETLYDPERMPGQKGFGLDWPYVEGLRLDEAMNPLSLLVTGMYGETLPNQNGAPIRLVVPWKYGYKSIKSIVRISFVEEQPPTTWNLSSPREYGFYSNVNPKRNHPRWSQARERRVGDGLFSAKRKTLMFNGYEKDVAALYTGMDLKKYH